MGHTGRIGGSKKESRAWAAESRASAVTPSRSPSLKRPRKPQPGAFLFSGPLSPGRASAGVRLRLALGSSGWTRTRDDGAFRRGFLAMVPLWLGVVPFALAYAVTARGAGLSLVETQALSALVFAGSAQFTAVGLFAAGSAGASIVLTTLLLNIRHLLYGVSVGRQFDLSRRQRPGRGLLPHRRGVRRRLGHRRAGVPVPARRRAQPVRHLEPRHVRRLPARIGDSRPDRARRRPDLPARVPGAARADASAPASSSASPCSRGSWPSRSTEALPGGLPVLAHRHRRQPARRLPDPAQPAAPESHPDDAVREVA